MRDPSVKPDYADVVMISHIEERIIRKDLLPVLIDYKNLPVYHKFPVFKLGDSAHKELLLEAQDEIAELQRLLS